MFRLAQYKNDVDYSKLRWTLDTVEDFELINRIYNIIYSQKGNDFNMNDIIRLYKEYPKLKEINEHIEQKKV